MRSPANALLLAILAASSCGAATLSYRVLGNNPGAWPQLLGSLGLAPETNKDADLVVAPPGTPAADWAARIDFGTILIAVGESPLAASLGFRPGADRVTVRSAEDLRAPKLQIVWEQSLDLPVFSVPSAARVFAREKWTGAPLLAGFRKGNGAVLWLACPPGERGYDRFPYIPQALADLGFTPPFRSRDLWAFFDSAYRSRVDLDYFAPKWRAAGIAALHVAAWHYWERNPAADDYLRRLIAACHRNGILVYAWFELPHVSDKFWDQHPEWREKTALGQDAQLDWRKLMNLANPEASRTIAAGLHDLVTRFDWDGVNLAELYFESLEGYDNPARFTPMNQDVRAGFKKNFGFDPQDLFDPASPRYLTRNASGLKQFLSYRADLAYTLQTFWIGQIDVIRQAKPDLDLVLTHVDDRFDATMREKIGADAGRLLPLLDHHDFTFLIEDPATIWNLGPARYPQIAARYRTLTPRQDRLAIDINVVERYQDVYPTKQQTGAELFQLVHQAALAFPRVALYFESSLSPVDLPLLPAAAAAAEPAGETGSKLAIQAHREVGLDWRGPALVDGKPWPVQDGATVWLPAGMHSVEPASKAPPSRLLDFNGELKSASETPTGIEFAYDSSARALALPDFTPSRIEIDGAAAHPPTAGQEILLPRGQHLVALTR